MRISLTELTVWASAFGGGIIVSHYIQIHLWVFLLLGVCIGVSVFVLPIVVSTKRARTVCIVSAVLLSAFTVGSARMYVANYVFEQGRVSVGEEMRVLARVVSEVDSTETHARYIVALRTHEDAPIVRARMRVDRFPEYMYGDELLITGVFSYPEGFITDTGTFFDYPSYLKAKGVRYILEPHSVVATGEFSPSIRRTLIQGKYIFLSKLRELLPEPHASLAGGILLGVESSLGERLIELFRITGLIHIIVLSGYNVTIVAEGIMRIVRVLFPYRLSLVCAVLAIVLFAVITGLTATVIRASIMSLLALLARATGNTYMIGRALVLAGILMVCVNPYLLVSDPSFQLSFIASFGLIYGAPLVVRFLRRIRYTSIREIVGATVATQIAVLPMILSFSGELSLVSVPVNVLALGIIPPAMFTSFVAGVLGLISETLATPFVIATFVLLEYVLRVVTVFGTLPFASVTVGIPSTLLIVVLYVLLCAFYWYVSRRQKTSSYPNDEKLLMRSQETV